MNEYQIKLKSGKPDRFGKATTKTISNFIFFGDNKEYELQINLYPTKSALDVRLKGNAKEASVIFADKGKMTAPAYFVTNVMPSLIQYVYRNFDVKEVKLYWANLAQQGLDHVVKDVAKNSRFKSKCSHCP